MYSSLISTMYTSAILDIAGFRAVLSIEKRCLFRVISNNERRDLSVGLDDSPNLQYPHIVEPLGMEARESSKSMTRSQLLSSKMRFLGERSKWGEYERER